MAIGAIASGGVRYLNQDLIDDLHLSSDLIETVTAREEKELQRREQLYRRDRQSLSLRDRTIILVDDGLATGASMIAAARTLRQHAPQRILSAVPVAAEETCFDLLKEVDEVVCVSMPRPFVAVGAWYRDFSEVSDAEVRRLLDKAMLRAPDAQHS